MLIIILIKDCVFQKDENKIVHFYIFIIIHLSLKLKCNRLQQLTPKMREDEEEGE